MFCAPPFASVVVMEPERLQLGANVMVGERVLVGVRVMVGVSVMVRVSVTVGVRVMVGVIVGVNVGAGRTVTEQPLAKLMDRPKVLSSTVLLGHAASPKA